MEMLLNNILTISIHINSAKCVALLGIIIILAWLFEIVTFYSPGNQGNSIKIM